MSGDWPHLDANGADGFGMTGVLHSMPEPPSSARADEATFLTSPRPLAEPPATDEPPTADLPVADVAPTPASIESPRSYLETIRGAIAEGGVAAIGVARTALGETHVVWANGAALDLLAMSADEVYGLEFPRIGPRPSPNGDISSAPSLLDWRSVVVEALEGHWNSYPPEWRTGAIDTLDRTTDVIDVMVGEAPSVAVGSASAAEVTPDSGAGSGAIQSDGGLAPARAVNPLRPAAGVDERVSFYAVWLRPAKTPADDVELARRESEHRFRLLAESAPVGIIFSDAGVRLGFVNNRFAEIAGCSPAKLTGTGWMATIYPEDLPEFTEHLGDVLSGRQVDTTVRLMSVTGGQRWVQFRLSPVTTPRRSAGFIGTAEDITERRMWEAQLSYQASHDALTGLANRRSLIESLTDMLNSRRSGDRDIAVLFCDLDGFKDVNDTLGHDAGDRVLIEVGQRLTLTARDHDLVARIAGDEFVVMMREISRLEDAESAARRQLSALAPSIAVAGQQVRISASIGIAMGRDHESATSLLRAADNGMYDAKRAGGGIYRGATGRGAEPDLGW